MTILKAVLYAVGAITSGIGIWYGVAGLRGMLVSTEASDKEKAKARDRLLAWRNEVRPLLNDHFKWCHDKVNDARYWGTPAGWEATFAFDGAEARLKLVEEEAFRIIDSAPDNPVLWSV